MGLHVHEPMSRRASRETWYRAATVLLQPAHKLAGHAHIKRAERVEGEDIDVKLTHRASVGEPDPPVEPAGDGSVGAKPLEYCSGGSKHDRR